MHKSGVVEYKHEGYECEGFAVWDDAGAKRPGILVFPEWVGVGEYTHKRAQMLGDLGFNAFVVDVSRLGRFLECSGGYPCHRRRPTAAA